MSALFGSFSHVILRKRIHRCSRVFKVLSVDQICKQFLISSRQFQRKLKKLAE